MSDEPPPGGEAGGEGWKGGEGDARPFIASFRSASRDAKGFFSTYRFYVASVVNPFRLVYLRDIIYDPRDHILANDFLISFSPRVAVAFRESDGKSGDKFSHRDRYPE